MIKTILLASISLSLVINAAGQKKVKIKSHSDSLSYALGVSVAETIKKSGITDYNTQIVMAAVKAQLEGKSIMDASGANKMYQDEVKRINDEKQKMAKKIGQDFLLANGKKDGVVTTSTGLQYKVTQEGNGNAPDANDRVTVHYHGTLIDGTVFDSSVERNQPATFGLNQVIPGWTEGLQTMKEGGKTTFYIPSELAYGARATGKIPANSVLIFDVELKTVEKVENAGNKK
ncbi:MAG: FKBP-type peptidyl-prolyl cis-trans isomerase [Flavobacteriales bacterium]